MRYDNIYFEHKHIRVHSLYYLYGNPNSSEFDRNIECRAIWVSLVRWTTT